MTDSAPNPYATSVNEPESDDVPRPSGHVDFGQIIRSWEKLRVCYNAGLASMVLMVSFGAFPQHAANPMYWISVCTGGIVANLCFFIGPAAEGYGTHFRIWHRWLTILLFTAGIGLTGILAVVFMSRFR